MRAFARDFDVGHEKRLSIDGAINFECPELAELLGIDVLRCENLFGEHGTAAGVVVLRGGDLRGTKRKMNEDEGGEDRDRLHLNLRSRRRFQMILRLNMECEPLAVTGR